MKRTTGFLLAVGLIGTAPALPVASSVGRHEEPAAASTVAEDRTQVFTVDKMTCASCPIAVKAAMERVKGVKSVRVDFDAKEATVVFDPAIATLAQIADASTRAGFPAAPKA